MSAPELVDGIPYWTEKMYRPGGGQDHLGLGTPIGTRRIAGLVAAEPKGFDPQFDCMDSAMGGYGLYYSTVMQTVGLVALSKPQLGLPVDAVTPEGQAVADAFRAVITDTEYYCNWIDRHDEEVPYEVAAQYGGLVCFCRLCDESALDRPLLVDAFLHHGNPVEAEGRRQTLRMLCELAAQTETDAVDAASFRRLVYYGADHAAEVDASGADFVPPSPLVRTARKWRLYQAREYFNASVNEMWRRLSYWGLARDGDIYPVPMVDLLASVDAVDFEGFAESVGVDLPPVGLTADSPYRELLEWVMSVGGITGQLDHGDHGWVEAGFGKRNPCEWVDRNISAIYWPDPSTHSNDTDRSTKIPPSQIRQPSNPDISSDSTPHLHLIKSHTSVTFRLRRNVTRFRRSERFRWSGGGPFSRDCRGLYARSRCS